jgi:hypothetical protein
MAGQPPPRPALLPRVPYKQQSYCQQQRKHDFCLDATVTSLRDAMPSSRRLRCKHCGNCPADKVTILFPSPNVSEDAIGNADTQLMACAWNGETDQLAACLKAGQQCDEYSENGNTAWSYIDIPQEESNEPSTTHIMATLWMLYLFGHDPTFAPEEYAKGSAYWRAISENNWMLAQFCVDMGWATHDTREQVIQRHPTVTDAKLRKMYEEKNINPAKYCSLFSRPSEATGTPAEWELWQLKVAHNQFLDHTCITKGITELVTAYKRDGARSKYGRALAAAEATVLNLLKKPLDEDALARPITVNRRSFVATFTHPGQ